MFFSSSICPISKDAHGSDAQSMFQYEFKQRKIVLAVLIFSGFVNHFKNSLGVLRLYPFGASIKLLLEISLRIERFQPYRLYENQLRKKCGCINSKRLSSLQRGISLYLQ